MQAFSGGFYNLTDEHVNPQGHILYPRVPSKKKRVCFIYDMSKPIHCSDQPGGCNSETLRLSTRLTRHPEVNVHVDGWLDPIPPGGTQKSPSRIDVFRVEVHGVDVNKTSLSVQVSVQLAHTDRRKDTDSDTHLCAHAHTQMHTHTHEHTQTHPHTYTHQRVTHICQHVHRHTRARAHARVCAHTYNTPTHTRAHNHTPTHTYTLTHTHTHVLARARKAFAHPHCVL